MKRFEPALNAAFAEHLRDLHRGRESFECDAAEIAVFEKAADETSGAVSDDYLARFCLSLQAARQRQRLAQSGLSIHSQSSPITTIPLAIPMQGCTKFPSAAFSCAPSL